MNFRATPIRKLRRLKIVNKTRWKTSDLRKLFLLCCEKAGFTPTTVHVGYTRRSSAVHGRARVNGSIIWMNLPNKKLEVRTGDDGKSHYEHIEIDTLEKGLVEDIAQVFIHEIGHNLGLRHKHMKSCYDISADFIPADFVITSNQPKPQPSLMQKRYDQALFRYNQKLKAIKTAEAALKRNKALAIKWKKKVEHYESKLRGEAQ